MKPFKLAQDTIAARGAAFFEAVTGAVSVPVFQSATFRHPALGQSTGFDYSRCDNPTRKALEDALALLEGGDYCLAFSSGMSAISALLKIFPPPAHVVASEDLYGGTYRLFDAYYRRYGYSFSFADTSRFAAIEAAWRPETTVLFIETPSNPMMKVTDIRACAAFARARGALLVADNTFSTPCFQNPLALGADFVVHSGTKYLNGHNDTLCGFIVHSRDDYAEALREARMSEGAALGPFDSWLALRGLKTLALRMERHEANALRVARWLLGRDEVEAVHYTGLPSHPQYALSGRQTRGHNGMISFSFKTRERAEALLRNVRLILFAESLGGVESLVTYPWTQTHAAIPEDARRAAGITERLIRLSVGIENPRDIIADLEQAFACP